jgi:hypothetical protein
MSERTDTARRASVRTIDADDPQEAAEAIAGEVEGELAADLRSAERAVRARVDAGRRALGDPAADEALAGRGDAIRARAAEPPPIAPDQVAELERLARELDRAARIRERTEARFSTAIQTRLAASAGVALHPDAIRAAATAVVDAEAAVATADEVLASLGEQPPARPPDPEPEPEPLPGDDPVLQRPHDVFDELALDKQRATVRAAIAGGAVAAAGVVLVLLGSTPAGGALILVGVGVGVFLALRGHRAAEVDDAGRVNASSRLDGFVGDLPEAAAAPAPPPPPSPVPAAAPAGPDPLVVERWEEQRALASADRLDATERLRLAQNRWTQLAGEGADPHDPEPTIRANDPQLTSDPRVAEGSPTVRAVAAFHRTVQAKWRVMWASLGVDEPPEPEQLDATLAEVLGDSHHAIAELGQLEAAESRIEARAIVRRPIVLVEPRRWITEARLSQLLASIPPEGSVVVVDRPAAGGPDEPGEPSGSTDA